MAVVWIDPVEITPSVAGSWVDVDCSPYLPAGTTGVILHICKTTTSMLRAGFRCNGSTDDRYDYFFGEYEEAHRWVAVGCDDNRIIELKVQHTTYFDVYLVGGFGSESTFFTNGIYKRPSKSSTWEDVDISSETGSDTAIAAIFEVGNSIGSQSMAFGLRKNGSTDNRTVSLCAHGGAIVGVDENEVCEAYMRFSDVPTAYLYLLGYMKSGATLYTNATDISLSTVGQWLDLAPLPSEATGGFIEVHTRGDYGLRKDGSSENIVLNSYSHSWSFVQAANQTIEGRISSTAVDFFLVGYPTASVAHQASAQLAGDAGLIGAGLCVRPAAASLSAAGAIVSHGRCVRLVTATLCGTALLRGEAFVPGFYPVLFADMTPRLCCADASCGTDFRAVPELLASANASTCVTFSNRTSHTRWDCEVN